MTNNFKVYFNSTHYRIPNKNIRNYLSEMYPLTSGDSLMPSDVLLNVEDALTPKGVSFMHRFLKTKYDEFFSDDTDGIRTKNNFICLKCLSSFEVTIRQNLDNSYDTVETQ